MEARACAEPYESLRSKALNLSFPKAAQEAQRRRERAPGNCGVHYMEYAGEEALREATDDLDVLLLEHLACARKAWVLVTLYEPHEEDEQVVWRAALHAYAVRQYAWYAR